jgi:diamine N-acetyltransferase
MMAITIRPCLISDLDALRAIGYETYNDTFRDLNTQETMEKYLKEAFAEQKMLSELNNQDSRFFFLYVDNILAGYLKLNEAPSQSDINDPESLEIERIYVRTGYKGNKLGSTLMDFALQAAIKNGKRYAWLGVWEKNSSAILFYKKLGFEEAGRHTFRMGDELQSDLIMKKALNP